MDSTNGVCLSRLSTEETIQSLGARGLRRKVIGGLAFKEVSTLVTGNISVSAPVWLVFNVHPSKKYRK